jgi:hypothetical protein
MTNYFEEIDLATAQTIDLNIQLLLATNPSREQWAEARSEMRRYWSSEVKLAATENLSAQVRADAWYDLVRWARIESVANHLEEELRAKLCAEFPAFAAIQAKRNQPEYGDEEAQAFAMLSYGGKYNLTRGKKEENE